MRFSALRMLPRWYLVTLGMLFLAYLGGWAYTIHLAREERAAGESYVMPVGEHDSTSYANLAKSLLQGRFAEPGEQYEYFHTPGYPAFVAAVLWLTGGSYFAVTFLQVLLVFATALMTVALGEKLVSREAGLWASLLFVANPLVPSIALWVVTDVLFMFLFLLGLLLLLWRFEERPLTTTLITGAVFAAAIYVRPVGFLAFPIFVAPIAAMSLPWRQKALYAAGLLALMWVLLVPWMLRNYEHSGVFALSSLVPFDMAYYNIPHFWADTQGGSIEDGIYRVEKESGVPMVQDAEGRPTYWYDLASSPQLNRFALRTVLGAPFSYAFWHLYNSTGFFLNAAVVPSVQHVNLKLLLVRGQFGAFVRAVGSPWWLLLERCGIAAGLLLLAVGMWVLRRRPMVWAMAFIILYLAALGGPSAQARYRLPVEPVLAIIMVSGIGAALARMRITTALAPRSRGN